MYSAPIVWAVFLGLTTLWSIYLKCRERVEKQEEFYKKLLTTLMPFKRNEKNV
jgi:hypothetical protein